MEENKASEATELPSPEAISQILAKATPDWSDEEVTAMITVFRADRRKYLEAEAAASKKKPKSVLTEAEKQHRSNEIAAGNIEIKLEF